MNLFIKFIFGEVVERILKKSICIYIYTHTVASENANISDLTGQYNGSCSWVWHVGKGWNMALFLFYSYNVISFSLSGNVLSVFLFLIN